MTSARAKNILTGLFPRLYQKGGYDPAQTRDYHGRWAHDPSKFPGSGYVDPQQRRTSPADPAKATAAILAIISNLDITDLIADRLNDPTKDPAQREKAANALVDLLFNRAALAAGEPVPIMPPPKDFKDVTNFAQSYPIRQNNLVQLPHHGSKNGTKVIVDPNAERPYWDHPGAAPYDETQRWTEAPDNVYQDPSEVPNAPYQIPFGKDAFSGQFPEGFDVMHIPDAGTWSAPAGMDPDHIGSKVTSYSFAADGTHDIYFANTMGGSGTIIRTPSGANVMLDVGLPTAQDRYQIRNAMSDAGISSIDNLLITQWHMDHYGGVARPQNPEFETSLTAGDSAGALFGGEQILGAIKVPPDTLVIAQTHPYRGAVNIPGLDPTLTTQQFGQLKFSRADGNSTLSWGQDTNKNSAWKTAQSLVTDALNSNPGYDPAVIRAALLSRLRGKDPGQTISSTGRPTKSWRAAVRQKYDPQQPRDERGKWTDSGAKPARSKRPSKTNRAQEDAIKRLPKLGVQFDRTINRAAGAIYSPFSTKPDVKPPNADQVEEMKDELIDYILKAAADQKTLRADPNSNDLYGASPPDFLNLEKPPAQERAPAPSTRKLVIDNRVYPGLRDPPPPPEPPLFGPQSNEYVSDKNRDKLWMVIQQVSGIMEQNPNADPFRYAPLLKQRMFPK